MSTTIQKRRGGVTLIEVLVAIFVMGIGLICLLTLFPLGAMRMGAAVKDERAAQAAINARVYADMMKLRGDSRLAPYFKGPNPAAAAATDPNAASYPVFVDPAGIATTGSTQLGTNIARASPSYAPNNAPQYAQYFSLMDDLTFQRNLGAPKMFSTATTANAPPNVERELLYTWAYLLQRPRMSDEAVVNATVCVFQRRPKAGSLETEYDGTVFPANNSVVLQGAAAANIQTGMWLLDATAPPGRGYAFGNFYRITGTRESSGNSLLVDVQTPLKGYSPNDPTIPSKLVILDGLVEVFELGPGR
jgi:prepilin-type N-terminal cleavage/methylation domain-containing protein